MFKWYGPPAELSGQARTGIFRFGDILTTPPAKKYQGQKFFEHPTGYLKRLHAHVTSVEPGAGYAPHADKHDVAIIVLEGEVRAVSTTLSPHGVYYFPAGEMHGMENVGKTVARYLVFEFHAPEPDFTRSGQSFGKKQKKKKSILTRVLEDSWRWLTSPLTRKIDRAVDRRLRKYFGDDLDELRKARKRMKGKGRGVS